MPDKFSEFMTNAAWEAVKSGYDSRDLDMVESACRHIRSLIPIDDDPTPIPDPVQVESPDSATPVDEDWKSFRNINRAMSELGLTRDMLLSALRGYVSNLPAGKSITRIQLSNVLEDVVPKCKGVSIGKGERSFAYAFVDAATDSRRKEDLSAIGVVTGPTRDLIVKCSPQNVQQFTRPPLHTNGHQPIDTLPLLSEAQQ